MAIKVLSLATLDGRKLKLLTCAKGIFIEAVRAVATVDALNVNSVKGAGSAGTLECKLST